MVIGLQKPYTKTEVVAGLEIVILVEVSREAGLFAQRPKTLVGRLISNFSQPRGN
jgi:hypothetical protein